MHIHEEIINKNKFDTFRHFIYLMADTILDDLWQNLVWTNRSN